MSAATKRRFLWIGLAFGSGVAALIYEVLWIRQLGSLLGSTVLATHLVLAIFFGGMALGAGWARRWRGLTLRRYVQLEAVMALFGLLSPWLLQALGQLYLSTGSGSLGGGALVALGFLLLPTLCMGATLPLLVELSRDPDESDAFASSRAYLWNTLGAACGALIAGMFLPRWLGIRGGIWCAASINALVALVALSLHSSRANPATQGAEGSEGQGASSPLPLAGTTRVDGIWLLMFALSGFCAIAYEVVWARALLSVLGNSIYSFSAILSVYLLGLALGGGVWRSFGQRLSFGWLQGLLGCLGLGTLWLLDRLPQLATWLQARWQPGPTSGLAVEWLLVFAVFLLPALVIGMLFPAMIAAVQPETEADAAGRIEQGGGRLVALVVCMTTIGSVVAPLVVGLWWMPKVGTKAALAHTAMLTLALAFLALWKTPGAPRSSLLLPLVGGVMLLVVPLERVPVTTVPGERVLVYKEGWAGSLAVVADGRGRRRLKLNGRFSMGGATGLFGEQRQGHLPRLLLPQARRILVLGVGTGHTLAAVAAHPAKRIDAVELVPGVLSLLPKFATTNAKVYEQKNVHLHADDARHFLATTKQRYDLIMADLFHSYKAGVGGLYTTSHYQRGLARLHKEGAFWQWLPLHQLTPGALRVILRTYLDVFPKVHGFLAYLNAKTPALGLLGAGKDFHLSPMAVKMGMAAAAPPLRKRLARVDLGAPLSAWSMYVGGRKQLDAFAKGAPHNTEDRPLIELNMPLARWSRGWSELGPRNLLLLLSWPLPPHLLQLFPKHERVQLGQRVRGVRAYLRSRVAVQARLPRQAHALLLRAAAADPGWSLPSKLLSNQAAALLQSKKYKAATHLLQQVVEALPQYAGAWTQLGIVAYKQGNASLAMARFQEAVKRDPKDRIALFNLALLLRRQKLYIDAARWLLQSPLSKDPGLLQQLRATATGLEIQRRWVWLGKVAAVMTTFQPASKIASKLLAKALMKQGQYAKAVPALEQAIHQEPKQLQLRALLITSLLHLQALDKAAYLLADAKKRGLPERMWSVLKGHLEVQRAAKDQRYLEALRVKLAQQKQGLTPSKNPTSKAASRPASQPIVSPRSGPTSRATSPKQ